MICRHLCLDNRFLPPGKGDRFKVLYTEKYVNDSVFVGHNRVHAAYFEHRGKPIYAIEFESDSVRNITEFFDEKGKIYVVPFCVHPSIFHGFRHATTPNVA